MKVIRRAAIGVLLAAVLSAGCAAVLVRTGDGYHPESAYIYGRFLMEGNLAAAFSIRCRDGKRYKIVFSTDDGESLRMIRLPPGTCQLEDVVYKGAGSARDMASLRLLRNEHLQPGGVYYVGDFVMSSRTLSSETKFYGMATITTTRQLWQLFDPRNNYANTTAEMKQVYPNFASAVPEDRMEHLPTR